MAAAEVDLSYLSTHAGVPEPDLNTAVTAPTADLVKSVLGAILAKLRDLEQDKFQLGVELEGAIRGAESRCEQFKATADNALKEVEELRQKLQNEGMTPVFHHHQMYQRRAHLTSRPSRIYPAVSRE